LVLKSPVFYIEQGLICLRNRLTSLIGLRTLKTAIAVTLGVLVSGLLGLQYPFFVGMTAIIAMERTLQRSVFMGKVRVVGSAVGATVGVCMTYIHRGHPALIFIGIILIILICNKLNLQPAIPISGIVFLWIMVHVGDASPIYYGFHRTFDSFIGASVSCLVNLLFLPYYNMGRLADGMKKTCLTVIGIIQRPDGVVDNEELRDIHSSMRELSGLMELYDEEYLTRSKRKMVESYDRLFRSMSDIVTELDTLNRMEMPQGGDTNILTAGQDYHKAMVAQKLVQIKQLCIDDGVVKGW